MHWTWKLACGAALLSGLARPASAQEATERLSMEEAVRRAVERSPAVSAARSRLEAAQAGVRGARASYNPQIELAPGVGFANGNALLSQQVDIGGRRAARGQAARGLREAAEAELRAARLRAATEARIAYFDVARAAGALASAQEAVQLARRIRDLVRRRVEIGEAPLVQVTRAEIEVARAEQQVLRSEGEARARQAVLGVLLGAPPETPLVLTEGLSVPAPPGGVEELQKQALAHRPELAASRGLVRARQGDVAVARSQRRPELSAEVAADVWRLDRDPFRSRSLGVQARITLPLLDRGGLRAAVEQARAGVREQEAELEAVVRTVNAEVGQAAVELAAAREVALNYESAILPRTRELLAATQRGFEAGLTSFLDVLEVQRLLRVAQVEHQEALFAALRARIALDRALGVAPGIDTPVTPCGGGAAR